MNTKKFLLTQRHFEQAVAKLDSIDHQKWIKTYFPFQEIELELPPRESIEFSARQWIDPIWDRYIEMCNNVSEKDSLDPWRLGFYKFFGGPDFYLIEKIEEVLCEVNAFPQPGELIQKPTPKKEPPERGWVYLISKKGHHKIGKTIDMHRRMKALRADESIFAVPCVHYHQLEKDLHSLYDSERLHGSEYFYLSDKQVKEVQNLMNDNKSH